jgi:hypothetical protein
MKKILLAALLFAFGASTASADPLMKYTYADIAYQWTHIDSNLNDSNGADAKLSYAVIDNFALEGGYNYANSGFDHSNINQSFFRYGGAGWYEFCNGVNLVGRVGGTHVNVDDSRGDSSDNGVYTGVGLRYLLTDTLEGNVDALYDSVNGIYNQKGGTWTYSGTLLQTVAENVAIKAGASIDADTNVALLIGLRLAM